MFTTRKENENAKSKPYYQVKLTLLRCKLSFLENPPKNEDEQYAYDIIQKAYEINEKKIEMLDFDKNKNLLEDYYIWLDSRRKWWKAVFYDKRI